jgi:hypothetical protein
VQSLQDDPWNAETVDAKLEQKVVSAFRHPSDIAGDKQLYLWTLAVERWPTSPRCGGIWPWAEPVWTRSPVRSYIGWSR